MINFIIQVLLFQALFLAVYDVFLQKETFFRWNRVYLLASPFLSFIIPLLKIESIKKAVPEAFIEQMPTVFINPQVLIEQSVEIDSTMNLLTIVFYFGISIFTILFFVRLIKIFKLIASSRVVKNKNYTLVVLDKIQSSFSFFNYIFIHKEHIENNELEIIRHELVHCKQRHTIDLLIFELLKIGLWFNPFIYVYQNRITLLHEYISDAEVVKENDKNSYFDRLLSETFHTKNVSFVNQFFKHSFIKKRILMITKAKSQKIKQFKYLLTVPLLFGMLLLSSFEKEANMEVNPVPFTINDIFMEDEIQHDLLPQKITIQKFDTVKPLDDVPFAIIENVPVFPGCEGTERKLRACLQKNIGMHVNRKFNTDLSNNIGLSPGIKKIFVMFIIDKEGNIANVNARAPHNALKEEAIRVVKLLPKMKPGKQRGVNVGVKYSLPIAFKIEDKKQKQVRIKSARYVDGDNKNEKYKNGKDVPFAIIETTPVKIGDDVPFAIVENVPVFPGCEGTQRELRKCLQEKITVHVNTNFNIKMAKGLGLEPGIKKIFVMFKIDKEGNITDLKSRAPHEALREEAERVVKLLPQMKPGSNRGKHVGVKYSLPIAFKIE